MRRAKAVIRKLLAILIGLPVLALGIVLIPLPGPGVLVTLLGLFILSLGFDAVKKPLDTYKAKLLAIYQQARKRYDKFVDDHDLHDSK